MLRRCVVFTCRLVGWHWCVPRLCAALQDLCPDAFGRIRAMFGVRNEDYRRSLQRIVKQRFSEGASGAFMCYSQDNRFVIKTMSQVRLHAHGAAWRSRHAALLHTP